MGEHVGAHPADIGTCVPEFASRVSNARSPALPGRPPFTQDSSPRATVSVRPGEQYSIKR